MKYKKVFEVLKETGTMDRWMKYVIGTFGARQGLIDLLFTIGISDTDDEMFPEILKNKPEIKESFSFKSYFMR